MDPAFLLLLVFLVYSVLLGVCLARIRAVNSELATMRTVIAALGNVQRDDGKSYEVTSNKHVEITPDLLAKLAGAMDGSNG